MRSLLIHEVLIKEKIQREISKYGRGIGLKITNDDKIILYRSFDIRFYYTIYVGIYRFNFFVFHFSEFLGFVVSHKFDVC